MTKFTKQLQWYTHHITTGSYYNITSVHEHGLPISSASVSSFSMR